MISINEELCLSEQALQQELKQDDLLAYRRLARHFQACSEDEARALPYLEKAARVGTALDALRYAEGVGSNHGEREAVDAYVRAARRGDAVAQRWLSQYFSANNTRNPESADWLESAARQGDWAAMVQLSDLRKADAPGVAAAWLNIAAKRAPQRRALALRAAADDRVAGMTERQRALYEEVSQELSDVLGEPKR